jgi:cobalt-zinc-cadmium efflux system outer membrane protein
MECQTRASRYECFKRSRARCLTSFAFFELFIVSAFVAAASGQQARSFPFSDVVPAFTVGQSPSERLPSVEPQGLTLPALEQLALSSNPSLSRAAALVGAAQGSWTQTGLQRNPSVGYQGQQLGSGGLAEQHGVLFEQEFVRPGKLRLNRDIAKQDISIAEQDLAAQQGRVLTDVRIAFYQVLLAQQQITLAENLVRISQEGSQSADALFKSKEVGRTDILQAQLEMENANILAQNSHNRLEAAWRTLTAVVGCPALERQTLIGDASALCAEIDFQGTLRQLLTTSPEVAAAAMQVRRAQAALERAQVEPLPNINVQGLVNWQDNGIGGKPDGDIAVTVPIPIFDRNQGAIQRAQQELAAARRAESQVGLELQQRLAPIFEQYSNALNQVKRYREQILPAAEESLELTRKSYQAGESNYVALLTAQRTFAQTNWNYLDALLALRTAEAQINGFLLQGSLQNQNGAAR